MTSTNDRNSRAHTRRQLLAGAGALGGSAVLLPTLGAFGPAWAAWPDRPIKLVVPFAAAGPTDQIARIISEPLSKALGGVSVIVENKPGAGGNIGIAAVARGDADGNTLLVCSSAFVLNPSLFANVPYDAVADFEPIAAMTTSPNIFVTNPALGVKTMADLVALAKKEPDKLNYASPGTGTTPQLSAEVLKGRAGIRMAHVVHQGAGPAIQAVLAGTTQVACTALPPAQPHVQAGKLVGLAVTGATRWPGLPDVPTMAEAGFPDFVHDTKQFLLAPAKVPAEIRARLIAAMSALLADKEMQARLLKSGFQSLTIDAAAAKAMIVRELPMWKGVVAQAGIVPK